MAYVYGIIVRPVDEPFAKSMAARSFDELLLDLYRCPTESSRWPQVLDRVCRGTGARSAVIQILATEGERASTCWMVRDSASNAARDQHDRLMGDAVNPRMQRTLHRRLLAEHRIVRDEHFFPAGDPARAQLRERLATLGLGDFMSVGAPFSGGRRLALVLHRDLADRGDFNADEQNFAVRVLPHLQQSVELCLRLEAEHERTRSLEGVADQLRCALVLSTGDGCVRWANHAARQIFARRRRLWVQGEQLRTPSVDETATLRRLIARVSAQGEPFQAPAEHFFVLGKSDHEQPLQIMMRPVAAARAGEGHLVGLILSEPCVAPILPAQVLGELFGLSQAEARLAAALCRGVTPGEYARERGVAIGTVRFQLKQVLAKTHTHRQGNLIQQLCSSVIAQSLLRAGRKTVAS